MELQFKNIQTLLDYFKEESTCKAYYESIRWRGNIVCPYCNHNHIYRTNRGFKCANSKCYKKFTVTSGTIFENTKIALRTWFAATYLITSAKKGISSVQLGIQLGLPQKTAWFLLQRIRQMLKETSTSGMLSGTVEVDETYVGGKNKNRHQNKKIPNSQGRAAIDKTPIVGLVQRDGSVVTFVTENTDADTIHQIIDNNVSNDAIIVTDAYKSYIGLNKKYNHVVVKHENGSYVKKEGGKKFHTQNIENFWSIFKRGYVGIYHYMSKKHLQRYCFEFGYRYNTRTISASDRFIDALKNCYTTRITYTTLIGK